MCGIMYDCYSLSGKIVDKRPEYRTIATSCQQKPVQNAQDMLQLEETEKGRQKEKGKTSTYAHHLNQFYRNQQGFSYIDPY